MLWCQKSCIYSACNWTLGLNWFGLHHPILCNDGWKTSIRSVQACVFQVFSGRENPWKMSVSWFLIEVATPEESGFSLETRCQGKCSRDFQRTSAGCLEPSGQWIWCGAVLFPSPSFPPELEEPRGSVSLIDITTCMSLGLLVKCKQFPGWQGGCWNYILGFQSSGTSEAQGPGWPLEWALFYTSGNFIEQSTLLSQRVSH